jgi:hypothetical protein
MSRDKDGDYEVGYGKPPRHTRFVKGQSGNPRGRPPGAKNFPNLVNETLNEQVVVTENGRRRKISKRQAIIVQLVNRAATANFPAMKLLFDIVQEFERRTEPISPETAEFNETEEKVLEQLRARFSVGEPEQ